MRGRSLNTRYYSVPVTLLKEYAYCPLQAYYKVFYMMEPPTESMKYAKAKADRSLVEEKLREEGVEGEFLWDVNVKSKALNARGVVDLVVVNGVRAKVVEVKLETSRRNVWRKRRNQLAQIIAYAICVEETLRVVVDEALIVPLEKGGIVRFRITPQLREFISRISREFKAMVESEVKPRGAVEKSKCKACFYRKTCKTTPPRLYGQP